MFSCPTCRKPLFIGRSENGAREQREIPRHEQVDSQLRLGLDEQNPPADVLPAGIVPRQTQHPFEGGIWRFGFLFLCCLILRIILFPA